MCDSKVDVCEEIDDYLLRNLELMEEKICVNIQIESALRNGHIELAKAKYIRGKENISIMQIPVNRKNISTLLDLETQLNSDTNDCIPSFDISLKKSKKNVEECEDPIKWFGVLVPQSLRNAQKRFQESLYLIARAASIQAELSSVLDKLKSLYTIRNTLSDEVSTKI